MGCPMFENKGRHTFFRNKFLWTPQFHSCTLSKRDFCPALLHGQNYFCPGQNHFCLRQNQNCPGQNILCPRQTFLFEAKKFIFAWEKDRKPLFSRGIKFSVAKKSFSNHFTSKFIHF